MSSASRTIYAAQRTMAASAVIAMAYRISAFGSRPELVEGRSGGSFAAVVRTPGTDLMRRAGQEILREVGDEGVDLPQLGGIGEEHDAEEAILGPGSEARAVDAEDAGGAQ